MKWLSCIRQFSLMVQREWIMPVKLATGKATSRQSACFSCHNFSYRASFKKNSTRILAPAVTSGRSKSSNISLVVLDKLRHISVTDTHSKTLTYGKCQILIPLHFVAGLKISMDVSLKEISKASSFLWCQFIHDNDYDIFWKTTTGLYKVGSIMICKIW